MGELALVAASIALPTLLTRPTFKLWLPGLPVPIEFDNPLVRPVEGQRLGDMKIQDTAEGAFENRCFGPKNRLAGSLVWMSDLKEVKKSESGAGKGGSGGEFITYQYFAHVMVRMCRAKTPISRIPKIWADGKILFDADTDVAISSNGIASTITSSVVFVGGLGSGVTETSRNYLVLESDIAVGGRPDLSEVRSGNLATVSGYTGGSTFAVQCAVTPTNGTKIVRLRTTSGTLALLVDDVIEFQGYSLSYSVEVGTTLTTAGVDVTVRNTIVPAKPIGSLTAPVAVTIKRGNQVNNGTFTVVSSSKNPEPGVTQISQAKLTDQSNPFRKFVAIALGPTIVLSQDNPTFKNSQVGEINVMTGGPDQAVPAILQQVEGVNVSQVYAMRFRAGFVLRDLNITDFGNRVPNLEALVEVTADPGKVADAIRTILTDDAQWPASAIDVSQVSGEFLGFNVSGPQPPNQSLQPLLVAFDVAQWERGGKVYFANRSALTELEIPASEVGAWVERQERRGLQISDQARDFLPSHLEVRYRSEEKEFQTATKRSMRSEDIPINVQGINLDGLVLDDDFAQQLADKVLAIAWGAQRKLTCPLPQSRVGQVREGMVLKFVGPIYGQTWRMFVERLDRGANMLLVASGQEYDPALLVQAGTSEGSLGLSATGNTQDAGGMSQPHAHLLLLDIPSLTAEHRIDPGVYVAGRSEDPTRAWRGAVLYWSRDEGLSWHRVLDVPTESVTGEVVTPPSISVMPELVDRVNTIRIRIRHPQAQLGSVTEDECMAGANRFLIGREIIGAARVTFVERDKVDGSKVYDLSILLRGQQDTTQEMESAVAGDPVVWLDGPGVQFLPISYSAVDEERLWRLVPHGGTPDDALAVRMAVTGRNCKPFHVVDVEGARDGSNNLTLTWSPLSRAAPKVFDQGDTLDEEVDAYEIDVVFSGDVVRTIQVSDARSVVYSAAEQVADGITPGDPVTLRFYQMSLGFLRGQESEYEV